MSEHKYRAWHKTERKMYTDVVIFHDMAYEYESTSTPGIGIDSEWITPIATQADEIAIMQFTGLNDKNGMPIYEGDIVRYGFFALNDINKFGDEPWNHLPEGVNETDITTVQLTFAVKWELRELHALEQHIYNNPDVLGVEVIGNIYEHPNLLEVQEHD